MELHKPKKLQHIFFKKSYASRNKTGWLCLRMRDSVNEMRQWVTNGPKSSFVLEAGEE